MTRGRKRGGITWRTKHYCLICGEPGKNTGCCDDPLCWAILAMYPDIKDGTGVHRSVKGSSKPPTKGSREDKKAGERMAAYRTGVMNEINTAVSAAPLEHKDTIVKQ